MSARRVVRLILVITCALTGCSGSSSKHPAAIELSDMRGKGTTLAIAVNDNAFAPDGARIDTGVTVAFTNEGRSNHDIKAGDPTQDYGAPFGVDVAAFPPGTTYSFRFTKPGVYTFYCSLHGTRRAGMRGVIVVGDVTYGGREVAGLANGATRSGTLHVPRDFPTIQAAVNAARPGALVLVAPGVYKESVTVTNPHIVIRGERRTATIVDGEFTREDGFKVLASGVAIENITARNFTKNGFFWNGVKDYRGSYLSAIRNGDYGIYAFNSVGGRLDHDYAAGSPDAGFYIGQCEPCNAVITDSLSEWNGLGYSGTNAGGELFIINSVWRSNRAGIVPNSGSDEANPPQRGAVIAGNTVYDNNNTRASAIEIAELALGNGILVAGGNENVVQHNLVYDHDLVGIGVIPLPEKLIDPGNKAAQNFDARSNSVIGNDISDSRAADLGLVATIDSAKDAGDNCFSDNRYRTSLPANLEGLLPCRGASSPSYETDLERFASLLTAKKPPGTDYKIAALPPPSLAEMPDALTTPPHDATVRAPVDLGAITVPARR